MSQAPLAHAARRIEGLEWLSAEQDLQAFHKLWDIHPIFADQATDEIRSMSYVNHRETARRFGTTITEQLWISFAMDDSIGDTDYADGMLEELLEFVATL